MAKLHVFNGCTASQNEQLDEAFRSWMDAERRAEAASYNDEARNATTDSALAAYHEMLSRFTAENSVPAPATEMAVVIHNASNDMRPFWKILTSVEVGTFIFAKRSFIQNTGYFSGVMIDLSRLEDADVRGELEAYAAEEWMKVNLPSNYAAMKRHEGKAEESAHDPWAFRRYVDDAQEEPPYIASHPSNGWGL